MKLATIKRSRLLPLASIALVILILWLLGSIWLNKNIIIDRYQAKQIPWNWQTLVKDSWYYERPVLPSPMQVLSDMNKTIFQTKITSKRSLAYHSWVTLSSTLLGFIVGTILGILLSIGICYNRVLNQSLLPWVIASQTVPILAIAPMIIVVLGAIGLVGLIPKSIISTYLCFFPITIGMIKGLNSSDKVHLDLIKTYHASPRAGFFKLKLPASIPYLFPSLKVAFSASLIGAIVGELPTGAQAGLGARLLVGSYYGQTVKIWSALFTASILSAAIIALIGIVEKIFLSKGFKQ